MEITSRRSFLKGAALGAIGVSLPFVATGCAPQSKAAGDGTDVFERCMEWDDEYDVVIIGSGGAGISAAIKASDAGAKVLIVEKAPKSEAGGNTRLSGAWYFFCDDKGEALASLKEQNGGYEGEDGIETIVGNISGVNDWFVSLGADASGLTRYDDFVEWPEFPSSGYVLGALMGKDGTSALWGILSSALSSRSDDVTVWYDAACIKLIQDGKTSIVHGCTVQVEGKYLNIRARNGVVMACGGFENNVSMHQSYLNMAKLFPIGTPYNTGDGITMSMEVGADIWHMANYAGCEPNFVNPDTGISAGEALTLTGSVIAVGDDAQRFRNESSPGVRHGKAYVHGAFTVLPMPENMHLVFDEAARTSAPFYPSWSAGNEQEIEKGWIIKASTIGELAEKIGLDARKLQGTVDSYNGYCQGGRDADFNRAADTLQAIATPPFYAMKMQHTVWNTLGGARRNSKCEILDVRGEVIPHFYGAGEFGSFFGRIDSSGYMMSECLATGMEAGVNAAVTKNDIFSGSVMEGKEPTYVAPVSDDSPDVELGANDHLGKGEGKGGDLYVKVTADGGIITAVEVVQANETEGIGTKAIDQLPPAFIGLTADKVASVDVISGATVTSTAIKEAIADALA